MTLAGLAYLDLFGVALFKVVGMAAVTSLTFAAAIPLVNRRGGKLPMRAHFALAKAGLLLAAVHIVLVIAG